MYGKLFEILKYCTSVSSCYLLSSFLMGFSFFRLIISALVPTYIFYMSLLKEIYGLFHFAGCVCVCVVLNEVRFANIP